MGEGFLAVINKHLIDESYSSHFRQLLKKKKLNVLQCYKRFNLMTITEKLLSWKILYAHYQSRIFQKPGKLRRAVPKI